MYSWWHNKRVKQPPFQINLTSSATGRVNQGIQAKNNFLAEKIKCYKTSGHFNIQNKPKIN